MNLVTQVIIIILVELRGPFQIAYINIYYIQFLERPLTIHNLCSEVIIG